MMDSIKTRKLFRKDTEVFQPFLFLFHLLPLSFLLFALPLSIQAQVGEGRNDLTIGVNGGYVMNRISFNPTIKQAWKGGQTYGVTLRYTCEKYFAAICALQAELNYANLGWQEIIETSDDTYKRDMHYIQVPLFARMAWGRERKGAQFFILVGPQIGFCLGETGHRGGEWSAQTLSLRPNHVTSQYDLAIQRKFEYGIAGGAGVEIITRHAGHFLLEGRYFYGLSDIFNNSKKDPFGRSANGAIYIKASYLFDLIRTKGVKR